MSVWKLNIVWDWRVVQILTLKRQRKTSHLCCLAVPAVHQVGRVVDVILYNKVLLLPLKILQQETTHSNENIEHSPGFM